MTFALISKKPEIVAMAKSAYGSHYCLKVFGDWQSALEASEGTDLMFVDLVSTLTEPGRIQGYEDFAHAKMAHPVASGIPLVVIQPPQDYELDAMVGWPNFVFAMVRQPVSERLFRQASGWV